MTTETQDFETLLERLDKLERQNQRVKRASLLGLAAAAGIALMAQTPNAGTIEAKRINFRDSNGNVRMDLKMSGDLPGIWLNDAHGSPQAIFSTLGDEPSLVLIDKQEKPRVIVAMTGGEPHIGIADAQGRSQAALTMTADGPRIGLQDAAGLLRQTLEIAADGPKLRFWDSRGAERVRLNLKADRPTFAFFDAKNHQRLVLGENLLGFLDANAQSRATMALPPEGPTLVLTDMHGKGHVLLDLRLDRARLSLSDSDGKDLWSAP